MGDQTKGVTNEYRCKYDAKPGYQPPKKGHTHETSKTLLTLAIRLALALTAAAPVNADGDGANARITPVITVAPTLFAAGKASNAYLCVSNGNLTANNQIVR